MINPGYWLMISIGTSNIIVIVLGQDMPVALRMLGIPALQLLLYLSADEICTGAKRSASAFVKFSMDRSARIRSWVFEGSVVYEIF